MGDKVGGREKRDQVDERGDAGMGSEAHLKRRQRRARDPRSAASCGNEKSISGSGEGGQRKKNVEGNTEHDVRGGGRKGAKGEKR
jgi:hypothetical protein